MNKSLLMCSALMVAVALVGCKPQPKGWGVPTNELGVPSATPSQTSPESSVSVNPLVTANPAAPVATPVTTPAQSTTVKIAQDTSRIVNDAITLKKRQMAKAYQAERSAYVRAEYNAYYSTCLKYIVTYKIASDILDETVRQFRPGEPFRFCTVVATDLMTKNANQR